MQFSLKTEYALRAIYELSKTGSNRVVSRKQISFNQEIPIHFLEYVLIRLKKAHLIESFKGPGGGYRLLKERNSISLWDIYQAVDMKQTTGIKCFPGLSKECDRIDDCEIKSFWFEFNKVIHESLSSFTLSSLYKKAV